jgi:hypothetical protein
VSATSCPAPEGGTGTERDPFRGLAAAQKAAAVGDLFLLGAGVYEGTWTISHSGTPGQPIGWRGQSAGTAIIDAQGHGDTRPGQGISASGSHDVWFEGHTIQNAIHGAVFHDAARIVVRHCHIRRVAYGLTATRNTQGTAADHFIDHTARVSHGQVSEVPPSLGFLNTDWRSALPALTQDGPAL